MHAEDVLEFESLRALLGRYVRSALGRADLEGVGQRSFAFFRLSQFLWPRLPRVSIRQCPLSNYRCV